MPIEFAMLTVVALLGAGALIWHMHRLGDEMREVQFQLNDLRKAIAAVSQAASNPKSLPDAATRAVMEADLAEVDKLCAELITLVPPEETPISADSPQTAVKLEGRRPLQVWPPTQVVMEPDLTKVDELCAKLVTLAPPEEAAPLLSADIPQISVRSEARQWPASTNRSSR